jgi:hypothetical protein
MPVFVRQGGIVPEQRSTAGTGTPHALTALVYPGSPGSLNLYGDAGTGLGYTHGQRTETLITTSTGSSSGGRSSVRVTIGSARGRYTGEPTSVATTVKMVDVTRPASVTLDGRNLGTGGGSGPRWSYATSTSTVTVDIGSRAVSQTARVVAVGAAPVTRAEPAEASTTS